MLDAAALAERDQQRAPGGAAASITSLSATPNEIVIGSSAPGSFAVLACAKSLKISVAGATVTLDGKLCASGAVSALSAAGPAIKLGTSKPAAFAQQPCTALDTLSFAR